MWDRALGTHLTKSIKITPSKLRAFLLAHLQLFYFYL